MLNLLFENIMFYNESLTSFPKAVIFITSTSFCIMEYNTLLFMCRFIIVKTMVSNTMLKKALLFNGRLTLFRKMYKQEK